MGLWRIVLFTLNQPLFHITLLLMLIQFINWMTVLAKTDLSYSQPITALSLISVAVFSHLILHEHVPPLRIMGMILILTGVWFITATGHRTLSRLPERSPVELPSGKVSE
jgi:drug/metabolite transporter (DMT)-like permease